MLWVGTLPLPRQHKGQFPKCINDLLGEVRWARMALPRGIIVFTAMGQPRVEYRDRCRRLPINHAEDPSLVERTLCAMWQRSGICCILIGCLVYLFLTRRSGVPRALPARILSLDPSSYV